MPHPRLSVTTPRIVGTTRDSGEVISGGVTLIAPGSLPSRSWPLFVPRREQADNLSNAGRTQIRPASSGQAVHLAG